MKAIDAAAVEELLARLEKIGPGTPGLWGRMNSHQMLCHLNDSFGLAMGEKTASERITWTSRTILRWAALRLPVRWPPDVPTRPEMDPLIGGTRPSDFDLDKKALADSIRRFARRPRDFRFGRHPGFGEMTEWEWMRWGYLHSDHHFRQFGA